MMNFDQWVRHSDYEKDLVDDRESSSESEHKRNTPN
jgi:hypothetical protein